MAHPKIRMIGKGKSQLVEAAVIAYLHLNDEQR
jgi:hypothetical protein